MLRLESVVRLCSIILEVYRVVVEFTTCKFLDF